LWTAVVDHSRIEGEEAGVLAEQGTKAREVTGQNRRLYNMLPAPAVLTI
jgi:high-affinity K+ transport system ATPase subunit B